MGIEPTSEAWEAAILPLNYARSSFLDCSHQGDATDSEMPPVFHAPSDALCDRPCLPPGRL
jgi:hypothetical protein